MPEEFANFSSKLFKKGTITEREFVELCLLVVKLLDDNWKNRQGFAYKIVGAWLKYDNIDQDDLLNQIGQESGGLELPDQHIAKDGAGVRAAWTHWIALVKEADKTFPVAETA